MSVFTVMAFHRGCYDFLVFVLVVFLLLSLCKRVVARCHCFMFSASLLVCAYVRQQRGKALLQKFLMPMPELRQAGLLPGLK